MSRTLILFMVLEIPVLFLFAATTLLLRRPRPAHALQRLLALQFPLLAAGGVGLPLWSLWVLLHP
jgi:hypothetical protein